MGDFGASGTGLSCSVWEEDFFLFTNISGASPLYKTSTMLKELTFPWLWQQPITDTQIPAQLGKIVQFRFVAQVAHLYKNIVSFIL